jgi:hypothetical protein
MPEELTETPLAFKVVRIPKGMVVFSGRECAGMHASVQTNFEVPKRDAIVFFLNR